MPVSFTPEPFVPRRGLRGAHRMTLAGNFLPREDRLPAPEERLIEVEPGVQILCHCHWQKERSRAATLIIVHGLEGSSRSQYVIGTSNKAYTAGMNAVRMNMRNCGGTEKLGATLYHSGLSCDVAAVVAALTRDEKLSRVALAGYSMGGNLVLKCAGEWGDSAPPEVKAVCAISPTVDLSASVDAIHRRRNFVYEAKFLWGLNRRFRRKAALFPERYQVNGLGPRAGVPNASRFWTRWSRGWARSIREFDDRITAPHSGFRDAEDYYSRAAAARVVEHIRVPTLMVHAADDPFVRVTPGTREKIAANPAITFIETEHGGHCAFLAAQDGYDGRWAERQIVRFIKAAGG